MKQTRLVLSILAISAMTGCFKDPNEPRELANIVALKSNSSADVGDIRFSALRDTAEAIGAQAGLAWRAEQINCMLKAQARHLDGIYNFRALMLEEHIVPPVLAEGRKELQIDHCNAIRAADTVFRIIKPPCFVSTAPEWRDYVMLNYETPEAPDTTLLPKTNEEAGIWNCHVRRGWQQGLVQANQIFTADLARLNRDYTGMILYHKLYAQNMVSAPFVAKTNLGVTGDAHEMRVNDRVLRISSTSQLNTDSSAWKASVWNERQPLHPHHHNPDAEFHAHAYPHDDDHPHSHPQHPHDAHPSDRPHTFTKSAILPKSDMLLNSIKGTGKNASLGQAHYLYPSPRHDMTK